MTPKEKAEQLVKSMEPYMQGYHAIHCAIVAVEEIISLCAYGLSETKYWQQVKTELETL